MSAVRKWIAFYCLTICFICLMSACGSRKSIPQQSVTKQQEVSAKTDSNDYKTVIPKLLTGYFEAINEQKWDAMMDMIYPKLFDIVPRELMMQTFTDALGTGMNMKTDSFMIKNISDLVIHEEEQFAVVYYTGNLILNILEGSEMDNETALAMLEQTYGTIYGKENITYNKEQKTFTIQSSKSMFAIAAVDTQDWKFIENNEDQPALLEQLLPKVARDLIKD